MDKTNIWLLNPSVLLPTKPLSLASYQPCHSKGLIENINIIARLVILFSLIGTIVLADNKIVEEGAKYLAFLGLISLFVDEKSESFSTNLPPTRPRPNENYFDTSAGNSAVHVVKPDFVQRRFNVKNNRSRWGTSNANNPDELHGLQQQVHL